MRYRNVMHSLIEITLRLKGGKIEKGPNYQAQIKKNQNEVEKKYANLVSPKPLFRRPVAKQLFIHSPKTINFSSNILGKWNNVDWNENEAEKNAHFISNYKHLF